MSELNFQIVGARPERHAAVPTLMFALKIEETTGREIHLDIMAYTDATGSSQKIDSIVERIRALLHNVPLTVGGFTNIIARCKAGPLQVPTDPRIMGRALTFQWTLN